MLRDIATTTNQLILVTCIMSRMTKLCQTTSLSKDRQICRTNRRRCHGTVGRDVPSCPFYRQRAPELRRGVPSCPSYLQRAPELRRGVHRVLPTAHEHLSFAEVSHRVLPTAHEHLSFAVERRQLAACRHKHVK